MPMFSLEPAALERGFRRMSCFFSALFILIFLFVALRRLHYPFELDRLESGMMSSVWRIAHGKPLYGPPTMEWVPFLYAPLFFYLSAALTHVIGMGYPALRLVSILSTLGSFALIYAFVFRETRRPAIALTSAGVFAFMYHFCGAWFDLGRVDSLSIFFFLAAMYATRFANPILAGVVWLFAFHSKQTFLPLGLLAFVPLYRNPRRMLLGMGTFGALAFLSVRLLNHATDGWYSFYAYGTTGQLGWNLRDLIYFLPSDIIQPLPILVALIILAFLLHPPRWQSAATMFYGFNTLLLLAAVAFVRAHAGANINAVIPVYAWLSVIGGLAIHRVLSWLASPAAALSPRNLQIASATVWLALSAQLIAHIYPPGQWIPQRSNLAYRNALLESVRATPGDIWLVNHSYDGILAGKPLHPEMDALDAVLGRPYPPTVAEFQQAIATQRFAAVLLDRLPQTYLPAGTFTSPAFRASYGLTAAAPGSDQPMVADQPRYALLPCADLHATNLALLPHGAVADATACPPDPIPQPRSPSR